MSPRSGGVDRPVGWRHFIYGGVASCLAEIGTFPLDMTKTRLQIQGQQSGHLMSSGVNPGKKYKGMLDALVRIPREEGLRTLYHGIGPALLRQSTYGTLKFGFYYSMKKVFPNETVVSNMICAVAAGVVSAAIANPTDVLKVRMQVASSSSTKSSSLIQSFYKIYKYEGLKGLWRGVGSTSQRAGVIAAVELPVYDGFKKYFIVSGLLEDGPPNHVLSSFIASFTAAVASLPIDVIRTRLMIQKLQRHGPTENYGAPNNGKTGVPSPVRFSQANPSGESGGHSSGSKSKIYKSSWECLKVTLQHEGPRALWKGFIPAWLRMGPWNLIFFTSYEQLLRLY